MMSFTFRDSGPPHPLASSVVIGARPVIVIFKQTQRSKVGMPCRTTLREQKTSHPASGHHDVSDVCGQYLVQFPDGATVWLLLDPTEELVQK